MEGKASSSQIKPDVSDNQSDGSSQKITNFFPVLKTEGRAKMSSPKANHSEQKEMLRKYRSKSMTLRSKKVEKQNKLHEKTPKSDTLASQPKEKLFNISVASSSKAPLNTDQDKSSEKNSKNDVSNDQPKEKVRNISVASALKTPLSQVLRKSIEASDNKKEISEKGNESKISEDSNKSIESSSLKKNFSDSEGSRILRQKASVSEKPKRPYRRKSETNQIDTPVTEEVKTESIERKVHRGRPPYKHLISQVHRGRPPYKHLTSHVHRGHRLPFKNIISHSVSTAEVHRGRPPYKNLTSQSYTAVEVHRGRPPYKKLTSQISTNVEAHRGRPPYKHLTSQLETAIEVHRGRPPYKNLTSQSETNVEAHKGRPPSKNSTSQSDNIEAYKGRPPSKNLTNQSDTNEAHKGRPPNKNLTNQSDTNVEAHKGRPPNKNLTSQSDTNVEAHKGRPPNKNLASQSDTPIEAHRGRPPYKNATNQSETAVEVHRGRPSYKNVTSQPGTAVEVHRGRPPYKNLSQSDTAVEVHRGRPPYKNVTNQSDSSAEVHRGRPPYKNVTSQLDSATEDTKSDNANSNSNNAVKKRTYRKRHFRGGTYGLYLTPARKRKKKMKSQDESKDDEGSVTSTENNSILDSEDNNSLVSEDFFTPSEKSLVDEEHGLESRSSSILTNPEPTNEKSKSSETAELKVTKVPKTEVSETKIEITADYEENTQNVTDLFQDLEDMQWESNQKQNEESGNNIASETNKPTQFDDVSSSSFSNTLHFSFKKDAPKEPEECTIKDTVNSAESEGTTVQTCSNNINKSDNKINLPATSETTSLSIQDNISEMFDMKDDSNIVSDVSLNKDDLNLMTSNMSEIKEDLNIDSTDMLTDKDNLNLVFSVLSENKDLSLISSDTTDKSLNVTSCTFEENNLKLNIATGATEIKDKELNLIKDYKNQENEQKITAQTVIENSNQKESRSLLNTERKSPNSFLNETKEDSNSSVEESKPDVENLLVFVEGDKQESNSLSFLCGTKQDSNSLAFTESKQDSNSIAFTNENKQDSNSFAFTKESKQDSNSVAFADENKQYSNSVVFADENQQDSNSAFVDEHKQDSNSAFADENKQDSNSAFADENKQDSNSAFAGENKQDSNSAFVDEHKQDSNSAFADENNQDSNSAFADENKQDSNSVSCADENKQYSNSFAFTDENKQDSDSIAFIGETKHDSNSLTFPDESKDLGELSSFVDSESKQDAEPMEYMSESKDISLSYLNEKQDDSNSSSSVTEKPSEAIELEEKNENFTCDMEVDDEKVADGYLNENKNDSNSLPSVTEDSKKPEETSSENKENENFASNMDVDDNPDDDDEQSIATCVKSRQRIKRRFTDDIVDTDLGILSVAAMANVKKISSKQDVPRDVIEAFQPVSHGEAKKSGSVMKIECVFNCKQSPIKTCTCEGDTYQAKISKEDESNFCQAIDSIDDKLVGCSNPVVTSRLVRASVKIPFTIMCEMHIWRLRHHHSCPYCGLFCSQGSFIQCSSKDDKKTIHLFHEQCQTREESHPPFCLHCGSSSTLKRVHLEMHMASPPSFFLSQTSKVSVPDVSKARISFAEAADFCKRDDDESSIMYTLDDCGKVLSAAGLPSGSDKQELEKVMAAIDEDKIRNCTFAPDEFYDMADTGNILKILIMIAKGIDPNEKFPGHDNETALHAAAASGHVAVVHLLIQAGAVNDVLNDKMYTPLMLAVENGHKDVVHYLVKKGALTDFKGENGMSSLHLAAKSGNLEILKILMSSRNIDIDAQDDGGWTPIVWASEHDHLNVVKYLLKRGANPNLRDNEGNIGLHWSAFSGSVEISYLYLDYGCDINAVNELGDTPLHIAARQDSFPCVTLFLSRGADVQIVNKAGKLPAECCIDKNSDTYLSLSLNMLLKKITSKSQHKGEKILHRDISRGKEQLPIQCINAVDNEPPPVDFLYVTENCETMPIKIDRTITSLQFCHCEDDCSTSKCSCSSISYQCWYDKEGLLLPEFNLLDPPMLFECNRACSCWSLNCHNRVLQNGITCRLQLIRTKGKGWGVRTLKDIPKGAFICEYVGELISDSAADKRADDSYLFDLDNRDGETYCLDARYYGNISRFINHLCEPNLVPVKVYVDHQDLNFPRIAFFSSRDIKQYEELGFDYGEKFWAIKYKTFTCECGAQKCKYSKDSIHATLANYYRRLKEEQMEEAAVQPVAQVE